MQPQPQIVTRGQHRVHLRGKVRQQLSELRERLWRIQLMQIINNQRDVATSIGELRQHPVDHRRCIEVRCRCWRFCAAGWRAGLMDRVEQGQPELLGVVLVALHLQHSKSARLPGQAGPGAQQRRLPAAGRSRDDRHLPRRRVIQGSDKITPLDQPGSCWSHRQRPALISTPDTSGAGHAGRAPSPLGIRQVNALSTAREPGSAAFPFTRRRDPIPSGVVPVRRVEVELCQLPHDEAAVGAQHLAGHRRSRIGGQVGDSGCGVIGCEPPPERLAVHRCIELFVGVHDAGGRGVG